MPVVVGGVDTVGESVLRGGGELPAFLDLDSDLSLGVVSLGSLPLLFEDPLESFLLLLFFFSLLGEPGRGGVVGLTESPVGSFLRLSSLFVSAEGFSPRGGVLGNLGNLSPSSGSLSSSKSSSSSS